MPAPEHAFFQANGLRFHALRWPGPGDAPPLLFVHATSFCAEVWGPVWRAARTAGAAGRAVAVDQRGHGRSEAPGDAGAYAWDRLAADVAAWLEALADEPALLVGHSSGGAAALAAATERPERVRGVLAVEPVLFDPPAPGTDADSFAGSRALSAAAARRRAAFASREAARQALGARFPYAGFAPEVLEALLDGALAPDEGGGARLRCAPRVEAWAYAGAASFDLWPRVEKIAAPVRVLVAEHSAVPAPLLERLCRRAPRAGRAAVAGATHFAPLERPEAVGRALAAFLGELA